MDKYLVKRPRDETPSDKKVKSNKVILLIQKTQDEEVVANGGDKDFPEFETFLSGLGTWQDKLTGFTSTPKMKKIYEFVNEQYSKTIV